MQKRKKDFFSKKYIQIHFFVIQYSRILNLFLKELLANGKLSVLGVAHSVGYEDALLFSRTFKKQTGVSPREYRKVNIKQK